MTSFELQTGWDVGEDKQSSSTEAVDQVYLYRSSRASGSTTLKGRSSVISTMLPAVQSGAEGQIEVTMGDGTDTITLSCPKVQIGAYSKSAQGGRYAFDLPLTFNGHWDGASEAGENEFQLQFA